MTTILTVIHVLVCIFMLIIVLLQHGKGADIGATFGGGNTVFGSEGPLSMLNKVTTGAAVIFMLTSVSLAYLSARSGTGSVMKQTPVTAPAPIQKPLETGPVKVPTTPAGESNKAPAKFPGQEKSAK